MTLAHTTAIVTGAGAGIGRQTALRLARAGARVGLAARSEDKLRSEVLTQDLQTLKNL